MADTANTNTNAWLPALKAAFPLTIPICLGFLFLGASYGILMGTKGGLRVKMCVWLGVSRGLDLAFLNAD